MFDWLTFLDSHGITHRVGPGKDVRRHHVGIDCPRCARDDGQHFSIDLRTGKVRGCWRDNSHWMPPTDLLMQLAGCSEPEARRMFRDGEIPVGDLPDPALLDAEPEAPFEPVEVQWPDDVYEFGRNPTSLEVPFHDYLNERGFPNPVTVAKFYDLRWCVSGDNAMRILFPLYWRGVMVGWQGRAITDARAKYLTRPPDETVQHVLGLDLGDKMQGERLVLVEGVFDALKLDWNAGRESVVVLAMLGLKMGTAKMAAVARVAEHFRYLTVVTDAGAEGPGLEIVSDLAILGAQGASLPPGVGDPGDLDGRDVPDFLRGLPRD